MTQPPETIFLSAGVPDPRRGPRFAATADPVAIGAAVSALIFVTMGRRRLVWGGQPAITAMVRVAAEDMGVDFGSWVRLYQSDYFKDDFPEENASFANVTYTPKVDGDRDASLARMRERMFGDATFGAAVFIGGMQGIIDECEMFQRLQPNAVIVPVLSTGGAALELPSILGALPPELSDDLDYVSLLHRTLGIPPRERQYQRPDEQPGPLQERLWPRLGGVRRGDGIPKEAEVRSPGSPPETAA